MSLRFCSWHCWATAPRREEATRNAKLAIAKPPSSVVSGFSRTGNLEALAFEPVTVLAALIESRKVTSTDLTKMYLGRLTRYGDRLHCVVTLTEDLALAQAANADKEIRAGKYRGQLHGIPFGVKDLFDTKGINSVFLHVWRRVGRRVNRMSAATGSTPAGPEGVGPGARRLWLRCYGGRPVIFARPPAFSP